MKNLTVLAKQVIIFGLAFSLVGFYSCNPLKKMQKNLDLVKIKVENDILEVHGDSINVFFDTYFPPKYFHKKAILKLEPILNYSMDSIYMKPFFVAGEKVNLETNKIPASNVVYKKPGGTIPLKDRVRYEEGMDDAVIYLISSYKIDSDFDELDQCICDVKKYQLSDGLITTSQTVQPTDNLSLAGSFATEKLVAKGVIYYELDKFDVKVDMKESRDFKIPFIIDPVIDLAKKEGFEIEGISMNSQASPDGPYDRNQKLAENRKNISYKYMIEKLKKAGFQQVYDSNFYKRDQVYEDWAGLKELISKSDLSIKEDILKIIASELPLDEKEEAIKKLGQWEVLTKSILPMLRKTEIALTAKTKLRDVPTLIELFKKGNLDTFYNKQELLLLGYNLDNVDDQEKLFNYYITKYPNDYEGYNNMATTYIQRGQYDKALESLSELNKKFPNKKEIIFNTAVCYRFKGEYDTALYLYDEAAKMGANVKNNKGILYIKKGDYEMAIQTFEDNRYDYNRALAYTLNKKYDDAEKVIEKIDDKSAWDFYLRAIVGARKQDVDLMTTSLTRAIKLDPTFREKAKEDREFRNYWNKPEFENAIR